MLLLYMSMTKPLLTCLTVTEESLACFGNAAPLPSACLGQLAAINCDADGQSCDYKASFAVQEDDSITITIIYAFTPANSWVGIGVSDDQMMVSYMQTNNTYVLWCSYMLYNFCSG